MDLLKLTKASSNIVLAVSSHYIIDVMAQLISITQIPSTFEELILKFLKCIPKYNANVHLVAD